MPISIIRTRGFVLQLNQAVRNGIDMFGAKVAVKFYQMVEKEIDKLQTFPQLGAVEPLLEGRKHIYRSLVIHKHFKIVYYIDSNHEFDNLYIVALWDTRREPIRQSSMLH